MQPDYFDRYDNIAFRREHGVIEMRLHTRGGPALWGGWDGLHRQLGPAFHDVASDSDNRVLIITGTGDSFCAGMDHQGGAMPPMGSSTWDVILGEGQRMLRNLLAIDIHNRH